MQHGTFLTALALMMMTTAVCRRKGANRTALSAESSSFDTMVSDIFEGMTLEDVYAADIERNDKLTAEHPTVPEDIRPVSLMSVSEVMSDDGVVHFLIIGDWGASAERGSRKSLHVNSNAKKGSPAWQRDEDAQENVAKQMQSQAAKLKPVAVLNVGDNFYWAGVKDTRDSRWRSRFENVYKGEGMDIPWLSVLGNHDYGGDCCDSCLFGGGFLGGIHAMKSGCSQAQIDYDTQKGWKWPEKKNRRWVLPNRYHKQFFDFGTLSVEVFLIDTNHADNHKICGGHGCSCPNKDKCRAFFRDLWKEQFGWFEKALRESTADQKIVVGHHPPDFHPVKDILPVMKKYGARLYLSGHVHSMRQDSYDGVHVVMNGAGGGYSWSGGGPPQTVWNGPGHSYGFNTLSVSKTHLIVKYITDQGKLVHTFEAVTPATEANTKLGTTTHDILATTTTATTTTPMTISTTTAKATPKEALQVGDQVRASQAFDTDSDKPIRIDKGDTGTVIEVDDDGDANIEWDGPAKKEWLYKQNFHNLDGFFQALQVGDQVRASQAFDTDSEEPMRIDKGDTGTVIEVDDDGDANIRWDGPAKTEWLYKQNFNNLVGFVQAPTEQVPSPTPADTASTKTQSKSQSLKSQLSCAKVIVFLLLSRLNLM